jgi:hypothetical protein
MFAHNAANESRARHHFRTTKALNRDLPLNFLVFADEVIE